MAPGSWDFMAKVRGEFGPRLAGKSGPRSAGFRIPCFRVFRSLAGWSLRSTLTGITGPMRALFGVPGWEELEYQDLRGNWFQVGGMCTPKWAGFSVQAGRIACLGPGCLCFPCVPPYGHRLFGYSVVLRTASSRQDKLLLVTVQVAPPESPSSSVQATTQYAKLRRMSPSSSA